MNDPTAAASTRSVVLLGAQRFDSTLGGVVNEHQVSGPIALITSGWQDREADDAALCGHLGATTRNLLLYDRAERVFVEDPELSRAHRDKQTKLRHKQDFYRIRLEHELAANHVIRQRNAPPDVVVEEEGASIAAIRALDDYHLSQCARVHAEFEAALTPLERDSVRAHRDELREILEGCEAVCIAGGHVVSMLNRMRLFGIKDLIEGKTIFAWTAGAMTMSERVVLFHDDPPQGPGASEILDEGLGLVPGVVVLPHPETRLRLHDPERVSVLARRFGPSACLAFPEGAHVSYVDGTLQRPAQVVRLFEDGSCETLGSTALDPSDVESVEQTS